MQLVGSGFPYCGYLEPEDFFGADFTDFAVWLFGGDGTEGRMIHHRDTEDTEKKQQTISKA